MMPIHGMALAGMTMSSATPHAVVVPEAFALLGQHSSALLKVFFSLGLFGVFLVSIVDSSFVPLPLPGLTDVMVVLIAAQRGGWPHLTLLLGLATLGSAIGGFISYQVGQSGGMAFLEKRVPPRIFKRVDAVDGGSCHSRGGFACDSASAYAAECVCAGGGCAKYAAQDVHDYVYAEQAGAACDRGLAGSSLWGGGAWTLGEVLAEVGGADPDCAVVGDSAELRVRVLPDLQRVEVNPWAGAAGCFLRVQAVACAGEGVFGVFGLNLR